MQIGWRAKRGARDPAVDVNDESQSSLAPSLKLGFGKDVAKASCSARDSLLAYFVQPVEEPRQGARQIVY